MKHKWQNLRDRLATVYAEFDSFSFYRLVFDEVPRFNQTYFDTFFNMNRKPAEKRLQQITESSLIEGFMCRSEMSKLLKRSCKMSLPEDGLPGPRVLCGSVRTDAAFDVESDKDAKLWRYNYGDGKHGCLHMTVEYSDVATGMRWARSFFLTALVSGEADYMRGVHFTDDEDMLVSSPEGLMHQKNTAQLLQMYLALVRTHQVISNRYMRGELTTATSEGEVDPATDLVQVAQ